MTERVNRRAGWIEALKAQTEALKAQKAVEEEIRQAEIQIRILFDDRTVGAQTTAGLQEVNQLFLRQFKNKKPDKISISGPTIPKGEREIPALVIPDALLPEGINQVQIDRRIITGRLVALFKPGTQSVEYGLYDRRFSETPMEGYTVYAPISQSLRRHGEIYGRQSPAVRLGLLLATVRAIYERANPQIFSTPKV